MDIQVLKNFLIIAEELNFTRAAERIAIVQPALSRQIQVLEEELGVQLFERTNRKVALTEAGQFFEVEITRFLHQLNKSIVQTQQIHGGQAGEIKIGHSSTAMHTLIPQLIVEMETAFPMLKIRLIEESNLKQFEMLLNREIDFGFGPNVVMHEQLEQIAIYEENFVAILPKNHWLEVSDFQNLGQLKAENFIIPPIKEGIGYVESIHELCRQHGFLPKTIYESVNSSSVLRLVEAGVGITIEPKSTLKGFDLNLKYIELSQEIIKSKTFLIYLKDRKNELIQFLNLITTKNLNI